MFWRKVLILSILAHFNLTSLSHFDSLVQNVRSHGVVLSTCKLGLPCLFILEIVLFILNTISVKIITISVKIIAIY